jgi:cyclophilin family peptidyl-prolyl cis-trans isomerase
MNMLRPTAILIALVLAFFATVSRASDRVLSKERLIMHTNAGDIVIALYPEVAPLHTAQILKMARAQVYEGVQIFRLEPGFVAQIESFNPDGHNATDEQRKLVQNIPAEFSSIKHVRGLISMARYDDPNSATSSFSFMLGDAPHLDGRYTIVGEIVDGMDVLGAIERVPVVDGNHPVVPLEIKSTDVVSAANLSSVTLEKAHEPEMPGERTRLLFGILSALAFTGTVGMAIWKTIFDKPPSKIIYKTEAHS